MEILRVLAIVIAVAGLAFAAYEQWRYFEIDHPEWWRKYIERPTHRSGHRGWSKMIPLAFLCGVVAAITIQVTGSYKHPGTSKVVELHNVRVLRDIGRYEYWLQAENGARFYTVFCADYEPQFSAGQTLRVLKYEDRGVCWSVANTHPAYLIERGDDGKPTLR